MTITLDLSSHCAGCQRKRPDPRHDDDWRSLTTWKGISLSFCPEFPICFKRAPWPRKVWRAIKAIFR